MAPWEVLEGLFKDKFEFFRLFCVFYNKWVKGECLNLLGLFNPRFAHTNMLNIKLPELRSHRPWPSGPRVRDSLLSRVAVAVAVLATRVIAGNPGAGV